MAKIFLSLCISIVFILMACTAEQERLSFLQVKGEIGLLTQQVEK